MIRWIPDEVVLAIHDRQIDEHGGATGVRDTGLLESALPRPPQLANYDAPDIFGLAAAYAFGIARSHPFVDGNKRTAYVTAMLFLSLHGKTCHAPPRDRILVFERLGRGDVPQEALAAWLRRWNTPEGNGDE
ncbi:MAG TPA: type II toxin-antitoxin system death-on-curing family toxin [Nitratidesulfovibrio sp.]|nr:type II toxin-antitoxin system death-on-curing family toxin [Nitratidesulfovibrio sp.]